MNEANQANVKMCNKRFVASIQQKISATIESSTDVKIAKMLSIKACPMIENIEVYNGGLKAVLQVRYEAVICLENGEIICNEEQVSQVNFSYESSVLTQNTKVKVIPCVMDNQAAISQGEVNVSSLIGLDIYASDNDCTIALPVVEESINTKTVENQICSLKDNILHSGIVKGEVSVDNKFKKIVFAAYTGYIRGYDIKNDYFVINGEMYVNFLFEYDDGQLKSFAKSFEFSEEIEQKGLLNEDILQLDFQTKFKPITNLIVGTNGETIIDLEMPYILSGEVYSCLNQEVIIDAYNTEREVKLTTESFDHCINKPTHFSEEKIIAGFNLSEDSPRIERILGIAGENISIVNTIVKDGEMILEGIANVCVIYYSEDEDGNKVLNSVMIDLPYSLNVLNSDIKEGDTPIVNLRLGEISVKNKKGRELEIVANVYITYCLWTPTISAFTTNVSLGEYKELSQYALEIVVANEGEDVWDIAKRLSIKEEQLLAQNSNVTLPLQAGEKLVVFRGRNDK